MEKEIRKLQCDHSSCSEDKTCRWDYYIEYQCSKHSKLRASVNAKMEERCLEIRTEQDIARCREFLDKESLLCLFGGVVIGYSLRSRKWSQYHSLVVPLFQQDLNILTALSGARHQVTAPCQQRRRLE